MRYSKERRKQHISRVRRLLVMRPDASILEIRDLLQRQVRSLKLDKDYINKLVNKIRKEKAKRMDRYTLSVKLAEFEDKLKEADLHLWTIANSSMSSNSEAITALREIRKNNSEMLDRMFLAGFFEKRPSSMHKKTLEDLIMEDDANNSDD